MEEVTVRSERFKRFTTNFDEYRSSNLDMFAKLTEEVIAESVEKLTQELDRGGGDFVDMIFRNEFR